MILAEFFRWYYYQAPLEIIAIWQNFLPFPFQFFGVRYHSATFFRPWHLIIVQFDDPNKLKRFFLNIAGKVIGVVIGMLMRLLVIMLGITGFVVVFFFGIIAEIFWLLLPVALVITIIQGFYLIV